MCFYVDYDWTAEVQFEADGPAKEAVRCDECRRTIEPGSWVRSIFLQELEYCRQDPESDRYDGPETDAVGCGHESGDECDFGETFDYKRCEACDQLIEAIHAHELDEGCDEDESRPGLGGLYDAMNEGDGRAYLAKAEEKFPGITARLPRDLMWFRDRGELVEVAEETEGEEA